MDDTADPNQLIDYESLKQEEFDKWKIKLTNILHCTTFCGICLEQDRMVWDVKASITIAELGADHDCSLIQVLQDLFGSDIKYSMANRFICEACTDQLIQAYIFIYKTKKTFRVLTTCLQELTENIEHTLQDTQLEQYEKSLICLGLETILNSENNSDLINVEEYICKKCNRQFANLKGLEAHELKLDCKGVTEDPTLQPEKLTITKCPICDFVLLNTEMEEHKKVHDVKTWLCSECDKTFYSTSCFEIHLKEVHNYIKEDLLICDFCTKGFFTDEQLQTHKCKYRCSECVEIPCVHHKYLVSYRNQKESGSKVVRCIECEFKCTKRISMISHVNVDHLQRFHNLCNICGNTFQSKPALRQHKLKYHNESFECEYCNDNFGSETLLKKHKVVCAAYDRPYICGICNSSFPYEDALDKHQATHENEHYLCALCDMYFENVNELNKHKNMSHIVTISCTMCTLDFTTEKDFKEHVISHPPGSKHICRVCDATFNSKINHGKHVRWHTMALERKFCTICQKYINAPYFKAHIQMHDKKSNNIKKRKRAYANLERNFECDLCGKKFVTLNVMKIHKEIHKEHIPCKICNKYFKPSYMETHLEEHEKGGEKRTEMKKLQCDKCDYATKFPLCLEAHENRIHLKIRPFKCEMCEKDFHARNHLSEHMRSHKGDEKRKACTVCGNLFANSQCLKKHMRIHTGEKPYSCEICNETFISASRRQDHVVRRHSYPEISCPVCPNLYHTTRDVRAHIKKAHCHIPKGKAATFLIEEIPEEYRYIFEDNRKLIKKSGTDRTDVDVITS